LFKSAFSASLSLGISSVNAFAAIIADNGRLMLTVTSTWAARTNKSKFIKVGDTHRPLPEVPARITGGIGNIARTIHADL
jgi:hypothetical protein